MSRFQAIRSKIIWLNMFLVFALDAQVEIDCPYILNPDLNIGFVDSCANLWLNAYDNVNGGFFTNVSEDGTPINSEKYLLTQTRDAYAMARGFQMTGDTTYLVYGRAALDFMYDTYWDTVNDGWDDREAGKWSFTQHYAMVGIAAMWEANAREIDYEYLMRGFQSLDDHLWDSRNGFLGYYDRANDDWTNLNGKGFTPTVDGITTNGLPLYLLTRDGDFKSRLLQLADNIVEHLVPTMDHYSYGFAEIFDSDWVEADYNSFLFTGHMLKAAWCLARAYLIEPNAEYITATTIILDDVIAQSNIYYYGQWWEWEQAFTAGMMVYYITGDENYLDFADNQIDYFMDTCVDHVYGDVYRSPSSGTDKGDYYKAGYHSTELGYYMYLYSNLYYHRNPASLYYYFEPTDSARQILLYPIAIEDSLLNITAVILDGEPFSNFDSESRTLNLAEGVGGIFYVTFENSSPLTVITQHEQSAIPSSYSLLQNYPNPFNPTTTISYELHQSNDIKLSIYNVTGQKIVDLVNKKQEPGFFQIEFNADHLASGVYFYIIKTGDKMLTKKMILMK